jgi:ribosomal protein L33
MEDKNDWITQGIKISCRHKISLYTFTKNSNNPKAKAHYNKYCKILRKVIKEAKNQHCSRLTSKI